MHDGCVECNPLGEHKGFKLFVCGPQRLTPTYVAVDSAGCEASLPQTFVGMMEEFQPDPEVRDALTEAFLRATT
jgi:hypothetical protein